MDDSATRQKVEMLYRQILDIIHKWIAESIANDDLLKKDLSGERSIYAIPLSAIATSASRLIGRHANYEKGEAFAVMSLFDAAVRSDLQSLIDRAEKWNQRERQKFVAKMEKYRKEIE